MASPIAVSPGKTCPKPQDLRTGDLVFPRVPDAVGQHGFTHFSGAPTQWLGGAKINLGPLLESGHAPNTSVTVAQVIGAQRVERVKNKLPVVPFSPRPTETINYSLAGGGREYFNPGNQNHLLLKILEATFPELLDRWLGMSVRDFVRHPISKLMIGAMNSELGGGFFVGHVGLIAREEPTPSVPQGKLMVHEGNVTDFSAYEVRAKLYLDPSDPPPTPGNHSLMQGWAGYRHAVGGKVWMARPKLLAQADASADPAQHEFATTVRRAIRAKAKLLAGVPYGFFDHPEPGDHGRLYCSEFVLVVLRSVAKDLGIDFGLEETCTWQWMIDNVRDPGFKADLKQVLSVDGLWDRVKDKRFFLYTVQMAWCTQGMEQTYIPDGETTYG